MNSGAKCGMGTGRVQDAHGVMVGVGKAVDAQTGQVSGCDTDARLPHQRRESSVPTVPVKRGGREAGNGTGHRGDKTATSARQHGNMGRFRGPWSAVFVALQGTRPGQYMVMCRT